MPTLRVLVADDDTTLQMLATIFGRTEDLELVETAPDADSAITAAAKHRPDVALIDVRLPGGGGIRAARVIRLLSPATRVVAYSDCGDRELVVEMFRAGAVSYLLKGATTGPEIVEAVRSAANGEFVLTPCAATHLVGELAARLEAEDAELRDLWERKRLVRGVLGRRELETVFQPIFDLHKRALVGLEALTRFSGLPRRSPDVWFSEAASVSLGVELERLAAQRALVEVTQGPADAYVAVNASPDTIGDEGFRASVVGQIPARTVVEITEHIPIGDYDRFNASLEPLRSAGVRIAIDDVGAGFASMRHILRVNPDIIKLDVSLTRGIHHDRSRQALAKALISFAADTGASVVAEGVEVEDELASLLEFGVDYGQGYLLGRPRPLKGGLGGIALQDIGN